MTPASARSLSTRAASVPRLQCNFDSEEEIGLGWVDHDGRDLYRWQTSEQGGAIAAWAATSPQLSAMGGVCCEDCDIAEVIDPADPDAPEGGVAPHADDPDAAQRLWTWSARLRGLDAFTPTA